MNNIVIMYLVTRVNLVTIKKYLHDKIQCPKDKNLK